MANLTHVVTGKVRLSYCNLFTPQRMEDGSEGKYGCLVLLPKSDTVTKAKIDAAIEAAKKQGQMTKFGGKLPAGLPTPIHDGDGFRPSDGEEYGPECKGHWVFSARSAKQPGVVDQALNPVMDQSEVYSGIYARVAIDFYPYAAPSKKGIGCSLSNVQKLCDGEPLGGSKSKAEDDFGGANAYDDWSV